MMDISKTEHSPTPMRVGLNFSPTLKVFLTQKERRIEAMFYLNQWKDAFKSESFTAKNIRTDRQTEVLPVGKKHYAVIVAFLALRYMSISWLIY